MTEKRTPIFQFTMTDTIATMAFIITMAVIMFSTLYALERQEARKAVECQEACVVVK